MSGLIARFSSRRFSGAFCASSILVLLSAIPILGQEGLSTLRGTVTDKSGAVVAGVSISAREVSTNIVARTVTTNAEGSYEMPGLKTGTYQVTATLAGFKKSGGTPTPDCRQKILGKVPPPINYAVHSGAVYRFGRDRRVTGVIRIGGR